MEFCDLGVGKLGKVVNFLKIVFSLFLYVTTANSLVL